MKTTVQTAYGVFFESNLGPTGYGIIEICNGRLTGFDSGFRYRGFVKSTGGRIYGRVIVEKRQNGAISIFGPVSRFEVEISGNCVSGKWIYSGHVVDAEHLRLRFRLADLAAIAAE